MSSIDSELRSVCSLFFDPGFAVGEFNRPPMNHGRPGFLKHKVSWIGPMIISIGEQASPNCRILVPFASDLAIDNQVGNSGWFLNWTVQSAFEVFQSFISRKIQKSLVADRLWLLDLVEKQNSFISHQLDTCFLDRLFQGIAVSESII